MQGMYNYVPQTLHVFTVRTAAAILQLQFVLRVMLFPMLSVLYFYITTFRRVCVQCQIWLVSCSPIISCFSGMLLRYFLNDFEIVPVHAVVTGIIFSLHIPHALCI